MERKSGIQAIHPMKQARFGLKLFSFSETSGYDLVQRLGKSGAVISRLMGSRLNKGYRLYVDNWYTGQILWTIGTPGEKFCKIQYAGQLLYLGWHSKG